MDPKKRLSILTNDLGFTRQRKGIYQGQVAKFMSDAYYSENDFWIVAAMSPDTVMPIPCSDVHTLESIINAVELGDKNIVEVLRAAAPLFGKEL